MMEEYYIGQIFEEIYPSEAADWCNINNATISEITPETKDGLRRFQIIALPEPPAPSREDVEQMRTIYRREHIDDETLCRLRRMANGTWSEEDEQAYLALDAKVTAYIEEYMPYPTDPVVTEE